MNTTGEYTFFYLLPCGDNFLQKEVRKSKFTRFIEFDL